MVKNAKCKMENYTVKIEMFSCTRAHFTFPA